MLASTWSAYTFSTLISLRDRRICTRMTQAERVISRFGGLTALANALGHKNPTTVQGWRERGFIPTRQIPAVLQAAKASAVNVAVEDLFPEMREAG